MRIRRSHDLARIRGGRFDAFHAASLEANDLARFPYVETNRKIGDFRIRRQDGHRDRVCDPVGLGQQQTIRTPLGGADVHCDQILWAGAFAQGKSESNFRCLGVPGRGFERDLVEKLEIGSGQFHRQASISLDEFVTLRWREDDVREIAIGM